MRHARNTLEGAAIALVATLVLTGCNAGSDPASAPKHSPTATLTPRSMAGIDGPLEAGPWVMPMWGNDPDSLPRAVVEVPEGYGSTGGWAVDRGADGDPENYGTVSFWSVFRVVRDPCEGVIMYDPGPGVRDLARALHGQRRMTTTAPTAVSVDGYRGLYLEVRFPTDESRMTGCHSSEYDLWSTDGGGLYSSDIAGTVSRFWILDVDGTRVVMVADTTPQEDAAATAEVLGIAASTHFIEPLKPRAARRLTYADGRRIHWGDTVIDAGRDILSLHVTDDGVAFTSTDGTIWFTDGSGVEQIGTLGDGSLSDVAYGFDKRTTISSGNAGSLVVWFTVTQGKQALVVYDSHVGKEMLRTPATEPARAVGRHKRQWPEQILAVLDDSVYAACAGRGDSCWISGVDGRLARYDLTSGERTLVTFADYQADLRHRPRQLVVGDTYASGLVVDGPGVDFRRRGSVLVALNGRDYSPGRPTASFVTGPAGRLHLRLPGNLATARNLHVFQWLDDDTLVLWAGKAATVPAIWGAQQVVANPDLLTCTLSTGDCARAVVGSAVDVLPGLPGRDV